MIKPHGSEKLNPLYVQDDKKREELINEARGLPSVTITSAASANAVMLGSGYFNPLKGYMNLAEAKSVASSMHLPDGLFFPVPILNLIEVPSGLQGAGRIALRDPNVSGNPILAIQQVEAIEKIDAAEKDEMTEQIFATMDENHPGVANFKKTGNYVVSGPIEVLNFSYF